MPLISDSDFLRLQRYLGVGYDGLSQAEASLESGFAVIVASTDVDVEVDMLGPYNQNVVAMDTMATSGYMRVAWAALQQHVNNKSGQNFNDYLWTRAMKVTPSFALLSGYLGVPVDPRNVA